MGLLELGWIAGQIGNGQLLTTVNVRSALTVTERSRRVVKILSEEVMFGMKRVMWILNFVVRVGCYVITNVPLTDLKSKRCVEW